ncbi:V-type ATP synthase subunit E [Clostridium frigidicarnis]|uniref:V-type proton ATPase subunit E n=1 Tax=Clostridium frigidicarnis TaxID=84698 RepID=A0A1I0WUK6_9CLOT|nr:V-type ATP synthase subunit E [Clostridium frigidicarnis]SFA92425.1 V/A-type H+-transporting ATPase subunit E [Clostridium frigidicarnis]
MSNLNNITSKIIEDAKLKADEILEEARKEEKKLIKKKISEANKVKEDMLIKAEREAIVRSERIISSAELKSRNEGLRAKGEIIEKVFKMALDELKNLEVDKYEKIFKDFINNIDICGDEEVIVPRNYKKTIENILGEVNNSLKAKGKKGELKLYQGEKEISSGFIVSKNGIYSNITFESLLSYKKDELEQEIAKTLFN